MTRAVRGVRWYRQLGGTFIPLLAGLVLMLVLAPLLDEIPIASTLLVSVILLTGIFTVYRNPRLRIAVTAGLVVALLLRWLAYSFGSEHETILVFAHLVVSSYFAFIGVIVVASVLGHREVTHNTLIGAVCGYLLIAYVFAYGYATLEAATPDAPFLAGQSSDVADPGRFGRTGGELLYFSFVTLTTLGYGDIHPVSPIARSLSILEVLCGQLYLAAFIARLISLLRGRDAPAGEPPRGQQGAAEP
ncbi:MAG: hypothetical protein JSV78_04955 [Phycisphaerales bacterium]|nr:MAG: hypothetical protein JSV78_04955 [Phycisphaerales bacterium]